jgi:hypothetical protein
MRGWVRVVVMVTSFALGTSAAWAGSPYPFVPEAFEVPTVLETADYRLRMLTVGDVVKDFDAVVRSAAHIQQLGPPGMRWPTGLTLEQNLIDLGWHQKEFQNRTSFAFTVVELDESRVVGCVYVNPTRKEGYDAEVFVWTRPPEQVSFVDETRLRAVVRSWLEQAWPFENPVFPGTDVAWEEWDALPEHPR